uniref:Zeta toxin family protein n=3 Tax=unclassified Prevotella TaxID=2638335 RepID=A0AB33JUV6_9BACT
MAKRLYILSGCNGAGKTTASFTILPEILQCREFVNADEIAKGLSPFAPESVAIEAGRLMLERIDILLKEGTDFSIETTLATRSYANLVYRAQHLGYEVILLYFWLSSPVVAKHRVAQRVSLGGHNIPNNIIERRYYLGLRNLFHIFMPIVDEWMLIDNSNLKAEIIAHAYLGQEMEIRNLETYNKILEYDRRKQI